VEIEDSATVVWTGVTADMVVFGFLHQTPAMKFFGVTDVFFENTVDLPILSGINT
jgi:hypothetical protein